MVLPEKYVRYIYIISVYEIQLRLQQHRSHASYWAKFLKFTANGIYWWRGTNSEHREHVAWACLQSDLWHWKSATEWRPRCMCSLLCGAFVGKSCYAAEHIFAQFHATSVLICVVWLSVLCFRTSFTFERNFGAKLWWNSGFSLQRVLCRVSFIRILCSLIGLVFVVYKSIFFNLIYSFFFSS